MTVATTERRTSLTERVAEEIRAQMGRKRMSGARLAKQLGVSDMWVSYRLRGVQPIDLNDLERIADALGVPVIDLLPRDTVRPNNRSTDQAERPMPPPRPDHSRPKGRPHNESTRPVSPVQPSRRRPARIARTAGR